MSTKTEVAEYIAALSEEMSIMAAKAGLNDLASILTMVTMEATGNSREDFQPNTPARGLAGKAA